MTFRQQGEYLLYEGDFGKEKYHVDSLGPEILVLSMDIQGVQTLTTFVRLDGSQDSK